MGFNSAFKGLNTEDITCSKYKFFAPNFIIFVQNNSTLVFLSRFVLVFTQSGSFLLHFYLECVICFAPYSFDFIDRYLWKW